jgi:hypothetical protein
MKRVPIFKKHPYLQRVFRDFPAIFVDDFEEVNYKLLKKYGHLHLDAQRMDMNLLNLDKVFEKRTSL